MASDVPSDGHLLDALLATGERLLAESKRLLFDLDELIVGSDNELPHEPGSADQ